MRAVIQRVTEASVTVGGEVVGAVEGPALMVLLGVEAGDGLSDADYIAGKIADLRLFPPDGDEEGMERSLAEVGGGALVISQFTLLGDCRKGRRPSWSGAARPDEAVQWYEAVVERLRARGVPVATGTFRAHMHVSLVNDGPVTVLLDSRKAF
jgi:D-tyrosyl-tRNA(Tyr) deacylase